MRIYFHSWGNYSCIKYYVLVKPDTVGQRAEIEMNPYKNCYDHSKICCGYSNLLFNRCQFQYDHGNFCKCLFQYDPVLLRHHSISKKNSSPVYFLIN